MSAGDGSVMVPADEADVGRMAQVHAMRVMADNQSRTADAVEKLSDSVHEMREDMAVMKSHDIRTLFHEAREETATLRREWQDDCRRRDDRIAVLLQESLEDRKRLWVAITDLNGKHQSLRERVIPLFSAIAAACAVVVSIIIEKAVR